MPPKKATSVNSGGGSGGKKAAKSSTTSKRNGSGQPRRKAENVKVRGRVPALAATILRTRDLDPRLKPFPQQADDDDILPWCETFLNVCHLPPLAMLDPGFRDARGRAPSETELTDIREFMRIVKEDPEICSKKPMAEIPGNKAWTRWAWRTWVPLMAAAVRAVLAKNGDTWTQRQMKSERKHSVVSRVHLHYTFHPMTPILAVFSCVRTLPLDPSPAGTQKLSLKRYSETQHSITIAMLDPLLGCA